MSEFKVSDATTSGGAASLGQLTASAIQRQTATLALATLQAAGAVLTSTFNLGAALPANARLLGAETSVTQALTGVGLVSAVSTVQGSGDTAGSILASAAVTATGLTAGIGTNPYVTRGSQQVTAVVTLVGINLSALTAGSVTYNLFYSVVA